MKKTLLFLSALTLSFSSISQLAGSGKAMDFSINTISIPDHPTLNSDYLSVEAWINSDSWSPNSWENVIVSKDDWAAGNKGYTLRAGANGILSFNISVNGVWRELTSAPVLSTNKWYHVAGTYDGTALRIYIDGVESGVLTISGVVDVGSMAVALGGATFTAGGTRSFDGEIDEVRIWNQALSQAQIQEYMCKKVTASHTMYSNLVAYYNLDQTGTVMSDMSANSNDGTVNGATQTNSGAAIGDASIFSYATPANIALAFGNQDSLSVATSSSVDVIHIYRVDGTPEDLTANPSVVSYDQTHYYGFYAKNSSGILYNTTYHYGTNPIVAGLEEFADVVGRGSGASTNLQADVLENNQTLNTLNRDYISNREMFLAVNCPITNINQFGTNEICGEEEFTITNIGNATNLQWNDANGLISGETNSSYSPTESGVYYLVANTGICVDSSEHVTVNFNELPAVDFGILPSTFCADDDVATIMNASPASGIYSGNGITNTEFSPAMAGEGNSWLYYEYTDLVTTCSNADSMMVTVNALPSNPVISATGADLCISPLNTGETVIWTLNGVALGAASTNNCITVTENGMYGVQVTNAANCTSEEDVFNVNFIGLEEDGLATLVSISPNPALEFILVEKKSNQNVQLKILNSLGQEMDTFSLNSTLNKIDISNYATGIYFVSTTIDNQRIVKRIVKK